MMGRAELIDLADKLDNVETDVDGIGLMASGLDARTGNHDAAPIKVAADRVIEMVNEVIDGLKEMILEAPEAAA